MSESIFGDHEGEELENLFGITEFEAGKLEVERLFDIIDRLYTLLGRSWDGWQYSSALQKFVAIFYLNLL